MNDKNITTQSLRQRLGRGGFWNLIATVFNQGSVFAVGVIIAQIMGRGVFGDFSILQGAIVAVAGITQFLCGMTATKYVAEHRHGDPKKAGEILGLCSVLSAIIGLAAVAVMFFGGPLIADKFLDAPRLASGLRICSLVVLFFMMTGFQVGALAGLEAFATSAGMAVISGILLIGGIAAAAFTKDLSIVLWAWVGISIIKWLLYEMAMRKQCRRQGLAIIYHGFWKRSELIIHFALPNTIIGVIAVVSIWVASGILFREQGRDAQAQFQATFMLRQLVLLPPAILAAVCMSIMNNRRGHGDKKGYIKIFIANIIIAGSIAAGLGVIIIFCGPWALGIFGKTFKADTTTLTVMMISGVPLAMTNATSLAVICEEKMWKSLLLNGLPCNICLITCSLLLCQRFSAVGLAWAHLISYTLTLILTAALAVWVLRPAKADEF